MNELTPPLRWDLRLVNLAQHVAKWSKDPSTQVGAVVASGKRVCGLGFNGFASGVLDLAERLAERDTKLQLTLHAEENALAFATETRGCTLYTWPMRPCAHCTSLAAQHGIARIVAPVGIPPRWEHSAELAAQVAAESGIAVTLLDNDEDLRLSIGEQ